MIDAAVTRLLPRAFLPPIWRELRALERWLLPSDGAAAPVAPLGTARPVMLIPGFLAADSSLGYAASYLRAAGYEPYGSDLRWNVDCSEAAVARLVARAEGLAERAGGRIVLVGHSRGGLFARVLARRRPELVSLVVTLAAPHRDPLAIHPLLWANAATLATIGTLGVPGVMRWGCRVARCCEPFWRDLAAPFPRGVGLLSVYSRTDGVVDWRACVDPGGRCLETPASHCGMVAHQPTLWSVAQAIEELGEGARRRSAVEPSVVAQAA